MGFGFFHKKKERPFLVLDVGTEAVKVLACRKENNKTVILGAATQYFERYGVFDGREFEIEMIKKAILKAIKENWKNWPVLLCLPPDVLRARVVKQVLPREKPKKKITQKEQELIWQEVFKETKEKISQSFAKKYGILPAEIQWITLKILTTKIDGYPVSGLQGYEGGELEFKILATFIPKYYLRITEEIFKDLRLRVSKIVHLTECLPAVFEDEIPDATFLDVGGERTQIFLLKEGSLEHVDEIKKGGKLFSQKLSETLGIDEESARILKERYANKFLSQGSRKKIKEIFLPEKMAWYQELKLSFSSVAFIFGGGSLLPEIQEGLKENGVKIKVLYPKDFKNIKDETRSLKSPQYTPSLLICYYAKEVF